MIKKANDCGLAETTGNDDPEAQRYCFAIGPSSFILNGNEFAQYFEQQKHQPLRLSSASPTRYWWYQNEFWATSEKLSSDEVKCLITEQQIRKQQSILRAKARVAVAQGNSTEPLPAGRAISQQAKMAVWQRDGGRCVQCGSNEHLEFDHIIPYSLGGSNTERNV